MPFSVQHNADLQAHNSLAVPALAKALIEVRSIEDLQSAIGYADQQDLSILVLGEGSNTVFQSDYDGLVILNRLMGIQVLSEDEHVVHLRVGAGESWHKLVEFSVRKAWYGLENLALIPGLVGAAPIQNIGAYGAEVKDTITHVEYLDLNSGELSELCNNDCHFAYRDSIFKRALADKTVITAVSFRLAKQAKCNIDYQALAERIVGEPRPLQVFKAVCDIRSAKLPAPADIPNAGSFFKNPIVSAEQRLALSRRYPDLVSFPVGNSYKLAAAWLIEQAGWKNKRIDGVAVHQEQALVVINPNHQRGQQVLRFARAIQADIKAKYGVELEIEPIIV